MSRVGIVGLGNMGMGMARKLMAKGHVVQGHARRSEVIEPYVASGGVAVADVAGVARGAQAVFLMVMDEAQADAVMAGGLAEPMPSPTHNHDRTFVPAPT